MPRMFGKQNKTETEERLSRLQELEHMLAALDGSHAIIEFDLDGTIITANDNFLSAMGYTLTEIQGQHHRIFVAPDARVTREYKQFWSSLASGEYYTDQVSRIDKSGRQIWLQASYCPVFDASGKVVKVMKFATDITEQRIKEADTEGQLIAIRRAQAVIEFDIQGKVITANTNFLDTVGYSLDEIIGKHHSLFVHPEESSTPEYQRFWQNLRDGIFVSDRCRRVTKQGETVWLQASYNPILDPQGQPVKVVKFALDITEQKQAEEDLKSLISEVSDVMSGMQEGNLTLFMQGNYNPELMVLVDSINRTIRQLGSLVGRVSTNAQTIMSATKELNTQYSESRQAAHKSTDQTLQIAAAAKQIFTNISKVTAAMSQMTSSVEQVSSNSSEAANVAQRAVGLADSAKINVNQLADSSNDIGAVIKVINSIADQTNLLALNATIEAARAGDAGKGFAVVANEVKELAKETAKATEEVANKISTIQNDSQVAVKAINDIGSTIENISKTQSSIASNVDAQSTVSDEINHAFHDVAEGSKDIELTISEATVAVNENQSRADHSQVTTSQLDDLAEELVELVSRFKTAS